MQQKRLIEFRLINDCEKVLLGKHTNTKPITRWNESEQGIKSMGQG